MSGSVAGFDIGSQTSTVAVARKRGIDVLLNKESNRETPSIVSFTTKDRQLGTDAVGSLTVNPKNTISQVKRLIGKHFKSAAVQRDIARFPFKVVEAPDGGCLVEVQYLNEKRLFSPSQLMAMILVDLRQIAVSDGSPVTDCVVSVPVYFTEVRSAQCLSTVLAVCFADLIPPTLADYKGSAFQALPLGKDALTSMNDQQCVMMCRALHLCRRSATPCWQRRRWRV